MARDRGVEATLNMQDGWPQIDPELWGEEGSLRSGISVGEIRNVAKRGAIRPLASGEEIIFPAPVQTQIVVYLEQGVLGVSEYDLATHGELMDILPMETTPAELQEHLFADGGDRMVTGGQELSNLRKRRVSHKKWLAGYQPPIRNRR